MRGVSTQRPQILESAPGIVIPHRGLRARLGHAAALILAFCCALGAMTSPAMATLDDEDMIQNQDAGPVNYDPDAPTMKTQPAESSER